MAVPDTRCGLEYIFISIKGEVFLKIVELLDFDKGLNSPRFTDDVTQWEGKIYPFRSCKDSMGNNIIIKRRH
jgi:hypothetical protein